MPGPEVSGDKACDYKIDELQKSIHSRFCTTQCCFVTNIEIIYINVNSSQNAYIVLELHGVPAVTFII